MINFVEPCSTGGGGKVSGPLDGVRVLEVASYVFVPAAAAVLADWGADVLKVEHPDNGDPARTTGAWGVPASVNGVSHIFEVANRGKRAIGLDIATPEGKEILLSLVDEADVFLDQPPARRPPQARHRARRHHEPQPAGDLRTRHCPRTARGARRSWRLRRDHVLGAVGRRDRRHDAGTGLPVADAGPRIRRHAVGNGNGRRHLGRLVRRASGTVAACSSTAH